MHYWEGITFESPQIPSILGFKVWMHYWEGITFESPQIPSILGFKLMPILPIRVSLRQNFLTVMMQKKHGMVVKAILMKIIHQVLMVLDGELKMSLNVSES